MYTIHMWDKKKFQYKVTVYDKYKNYSATNMLSAECLNVTCGNYSYKIRHSSTGIARMG